MGIGRRKFSSSARMPGVSVSSSRLPRGPSSSSIERWNPPVAPVPDKLPNPDPARYEIIDAAQVGKFLILKIKYLDCTNFEGMKILVFKDTNPIDLLKQKLIDPHFFESKKYKSPIARFVPTNEGWQMAIRFAENEK